MKRTTNLPINKAFASLHAWIVKKSTLRPIAGAVALIWIILRLRAYVTTKSNSSKFPSPRFALPYFGHIFQLGYDAMGTISQWHKCYGPIILVQAGVKQVVLISDPFIAHEILGTKGILSSKRPYNKFITEVYSRNGRGITAADIDTKSRRKTLAIVTTVFGPSSVNKKLPDMCKEAEELVDILATGENVEPYPHLLRSSLNHITLNCFGKRSTSTDDPLYKNAEYLITYMTKLTKIKYMASGYLPLLSFIDYLIGSKRAFARYIETERDPWILELMMGAYNDDKECIATTLMKSVHAGEIDEAAAIVSLSDIIGGGMETTAVTIDWAFAILSVKADVQRKIQQEIDHFMDTHKRMPMFTDRDQFPYMIAVQKECMRFRPTTTAGIPHETSEDIVWQNKIIPRGSIIITNMITMHMNHDIYPEPHVFRPERFLDKTETFTASAKSKIKNRDQYNFGWGRRQCPGIYLAEVHMFNVFTHVFAKCTIEPRVDREGCPVPLDLENFHPRRDGMVMAASSYRVRFIRRAKKHIP